MGTVRGLLKVKGNAIWSIDPSASVYDAIKRMADKKIGALMVIENTKLVGVVSERDYARKVILQDRSSKTTTVAAIMTKRVVYALPDHGIDECMALMTKKRVRHLPIMDGDQIIGVVSIGDLVKSIIADQQFIIEQLERYIGG